MKRILAIDYGRKRVGLAVCDESHTVISQLPALANGSASFWPNLGQIIAEQQPSDVVIGLPATADGQPSVLHNEILGFRRALEKRNPAINFHFFDESFTSVQAEETMIELQALAGSKRKLKNKKEKLDSLAAFYLLQSFLNSLG